MMERSYIDLLRSAYRDRLKAVGIPALPDRRTVEQAAHAEMLLWAARSEAMIDVGSIDRAELEAT